ncbi:hypothetical protein LP422_18005 [Janibacter limosus]|uniref:Uncharacterized protein n=1 Tax=Janibacter limosus TaxID=53458 RepID=A0AC61U2U1_9MICO|nr:hypothetical protein [Janibacter limosus]UUZ44332.1 hypothetical protein LP422_18005 [Janibacter limosus]
MCRQATCRMCGKTTRAGCGQHVDRVMAGVPRADRCPGHADAPKSSAPGAGVLSRLLGRG